MKHWVILIWLLPTILLGQEYALAIGEKDKERLYVLNEIYTPKTIDFLSGLVKSGESVLDVGCGSGLVSQELAHLVGNSGRVLAIDQSDKQLAVAQALLDHELPQLSFKKLSAFELHTLNETFDVVYIRFLLCHLTNPQEVLQQVKNLLKPGGRLVIEDITGNNTLYSVPHTRGLEVHRYFDQLQFELQQSDDTYFAKLPEWLKGMGFSITLSKTSHPELDTLKKREMLTYDLASLKDALIQAGKITLEEYEEMYPFVEKLAEDLSIQVFSYEMGHVAATVMDDES